MVVSLAPSLPVEIGTLDSLSARLARHERQVVVHQRLHAEWPHLHEQLVPAHPPQRIIHAVRELAVHEELRLGIALG